MSASSSPSAALRRLPSDAVAGSLLGALGIYVVVTAAGWPILDVDGPGPGFFPLIYGIGLIAGSLLLVLGGVRRRPRPGARDADRAGVLRALGLWAVFALSILLMDVLGFGVALGLLIVFFARMIFRRSALFTAASAILTPLGFHLVFTLLLGVQLPVGRWTGF